MKKVVMGAVFAGLAASCTYVSAAEESTFFGLSLGEKYELMPCRSPRTVICSTDKKSVMALSGGEIVAMTLAFPRELVPDWIFVNSGQVALIDNNIEAIMIASDTPSRLIGESGLKDLYQHLTAKLGRENSRERIDAFGQRYHFIATWNKPYGKVTFESAANIPTSAAALPVIRIYSNKYLALLEAEKKIREQRKNESDAKRLKF